MALREEAPLPLGDPPPFTTPETRLRERLITILNAEFEAEEIVFASDRLHDSLGAEGPVGAVYPGPSKENIRDVQVLDVTAYVQLFGKWTPEVNPKQHVDPTAIEEWAERLRRACQADGELGDEHIWYYRVMNVSYPADPTGNISRLLATVTAKAQNPAVELTAG